MRPELADYGTARERKAWHTQMRADMPTVYDAIYGRGLWAGIGLMLAIIAGICLLNAFGISFPGGGGLD